MVLTPARWTPTLYGKCADPCSQAISGWCLLCKPCRSCRAGERGAAGRGGASHLPQEQRQLAPPPWLGEKRVRLGSVLPPSSQLSEADAASRPQRVNVVLGPQTTAPVTQHTGVCVCVLKARDIHTPPGQQRPQEPQVRLGHVLPLSLLQTQLVVLRVCRVVSLHQQR